MAEGDHHLSIIPDAVREHKIEHATFFPRILAFKQGLGVLGQFEQGRTFVHEGLLGVLMMLDGTEAALLLLAPMLRHCVEERSIHATIELVHVHGINPFPKTLVFRLQSP